MSKKYFYNSITFVLVSCFVFTPFFSVWKTKKVEAQGIEGYVGGLLPIIAKLPQCNAVTSNKMKGLFTGIGNFIGIGKNNDDNSEFTSDELDAAQELDTEISDFNADQLFEDMAKTLGDQIGSVETSDSRARALLEDLLKRTKKIEKSTTSINENSTCIQSIGRLIIKMLLQKVTVSTVNWINSGFNGKPAFIQNTGKFFGDIAKNEILQFGLEINNPELFPFGKAWLKDTARSFDNKFYDNAQYSLNRLIQNTTPDYSAVTFQQDFGRGGWNAWLAMTQYPQNNAFGFKVLADNEIQTRLAGTEQSNAQNIRDALQAANGFLGDERCINPKGLTRQEDYEAKVRGKIDADGFIEGTCQEWQYVTPGKLVSEAATTALNYQNNAYLNVEDLNDAVAAVIDALLSQFSTHIIEKGFASFDETGSDGRLIYDTGYSTDPYRSRTEKDFSPVHLSNSWLSANPDFNIRTDLSQSLIDEQRTYSDKLALQNKELLSTTDGKPYDINSSTGVSNAYGLLPTIYQLDYCIPGPHPGWEDDARENLDIAVNLIPSETKETLEDRDLDSIIAGSKVFGTIIILKIGEKIGRKIGKVAKNVLGPILAVIFNFAIDSLFGKDDFEKVRAHYSSHLNEITGYFPDYNNKNDDRVGYILSKQGVSNVINAVFDRYVNIMNETYFSSIDILPAAAKEAASAFNQSNGYLRIIEKNQEKTVSLKNTVKILGEIKEKIDLLNLEFPDGGEDYEEKLKSEINAFGRVSASMVNGDDIARADNILKQIIDKKDYIYKNLLKGPYGCEADLMKPAKPFPSPKGTVLEPALDWKNFNVNSVKRMDYPFEIMYDYNLFSKGSSLPDPLNATKIYDNKMPSQNQYDTYGPGFLSFVVFSTEESSSHVERGPERLKIHDLVPQDRNEGSRYRSVGNRTLIPMPTGNTGPGPFENIMDLY